MALGRIAEIINLAKDGLSANEIAEAILMSESHIRRTIRHAKRSGLLPGTISTATRHPKIAESAREGVLNDWFAAIYIVKEIAERNCLVGQTSVQSIIERGKINGDPRALSGKERIAKAARIREEERRPPAPPIKSSSLAKEIGIITGNARVFRESYPGAAPRDNVVTLSGGLFRSGGNEGDHKKIRSVDRGNQSRRA